MILYNVTVQVSHAVAELWLSWLFNEHIPAVMGTECFESYRVWRLLEVDETEGLTYAIQYEAASKALYNRYILKYAAEQRERSLKRWGDQFIAFRSVMQQVEALN